MPVKIRQKMYFIIQLLFPETCPACEKILAKNELEIGFCKKCSKDIKLAAKNCCMRCGQILINSSKEFCPTCEKGRHEFDQGKSLYRYSGPIKMAMYRFKYSNRRCYGRIFARQAKKSYWNWIQRIQPDVIIPVPMYKGKERKRGYNQAECFAKALSYEFDIPVENKIVRRIRDTAPMKQLNGVERVKNLQKAFTIEGNIVKFRKVLLIDDIYTTGSTMDMISKELRASGVDKIYCLTVATGEQS